MIERIDAIGLATALLTGALLGAFYFAGLWWTVRRLARAQHPLRLYFAGLAVRLALVLAAFQLVLTSFGWPQLLAALTGFMAVRLASARWLAGAPGADAASRGAI